MMNFQFSEKQNNEVFYSASTGGFFIENIHGNKMPVDVVKITAQTHKELIELQSQGKIIVVGSSGFPEAIDPPTLTLEQETAVFVARIQKKLDAFAKTKGYDGILSACTYATSTVPKFATEGQAAVSIRDNVWASCYSVLGAVQNGTRPMPTFAEIEAELPSMEWPVVT